MEQQEPETLESISVRFEDVTIAITASPEGVTNGRTKEQIIKFCADLLLRTTDQSSLENFLDMATSIEEVLRIDYDFKPVEISKFMAVWRKRLYFKQIGEENPPVEIIVGTRAIEPSSDEDHGDNGDTVVPKPVLTDNHVTISIPISAKILSKPEEKSEEKVESASFTVIEKDKP